MLGLQELTECPSQSPSHCLQVARPKGRASALRVLGAAPGAATCDGQRFQDPKSIFFTGPCYPSGTTGGPRSSLSSMPPRLEEGGLARRGQLGVYVVYYCRTSNRAQIMVLKRCSCTLFVNCICIVHQPLSLPISPPPLLPPSHPSALSLYPSPDPPGSYRRPCSFFKTISELV